MFQINNLKKYKYLNLNIYHFIFLFWVSLWFAIGTDFNQLDKINFGNSLRVLRIVIVILLTFVSFILIFFLKKKNNLLLYLFYIFFFFQMIGLLQNDETKYNINNWYIILLAIGSLNLLLIANSINKKILNQLLPLSCLIVGLFSFIILLPKFYEIFNLFKTITKISLYSFIELNEVNIFGIGLPRVTGLARLLAVFNLYLIVKLNYQNKLKTFLSLTLISIITSLIWLIESRAAIICFYICAILIIIFFNNFSYFKKFVFFLLILILPLTAINTLNNFFISFNKLSPDRPTPTKNIEQESRNIEQESRNIEQESRNIEQESRNIEQESRLTNFSTSGRIDLWIEGINYYELNKFFGYGSQGDRFLLIKARNAQKIKQSYGTNISNTILYSLLSGGYLSILIIFFIYIKIFQFIYLFFKKKNYELLDSSIKMSIILLIFFLIRSMVENSFALFSVDFLLFANSFLIMDKFLKRN